MSMFDWLFGGSDDSAQDAQLQANRESMRFIKEMADQARSDALGLAPGATANRGMGYQGAFDVLGQTIPQQMDLFQQGNMGAQSNLLAGLDQFQNAIMGRPVDMSALQPRELQYDTSWAQQQVPDFLSAADLLGGGGGGPPDENYPPGQTQPDGTMPVNMEQYNLGREMQNNTYLGDLMRRADISRARDNYNNRHGSNMGQPFGDRSSLTGDLKDNWQGDWLDELFGRENIESLASMNLGENANKYGKLGALLGIPGSGMAALLGRLAGRNDFGFSPLDKNNPYNTDGFTDTDTGNLLGDLFNPDRNLPKSGLWDGVTAGPGAGRGTMFGMPGGTYAGYGGRPDYSAHTDVPGADGWGTGNYGSYGANWDDNSTTRDSTGGRTATDSGRGGDWYGNWGFFGGSRIPHWKRKASG